MPKKTKAVYTIITTYALQRDMIFTLQGDAAKSFISAVNTRTGEYHEIPFKNDMYSDFLYTCEGFIKEHFGRHLIYYARKSYQKGEER